MRLEDEATAAPTATPVATATAPASPPTATTPAAAEDDSPKLLGLPLPEPLEDASGLVFSDPRNHWEAVDHAALLALVEALAGARGKEASLVKRLRDVEKNLGTADVSKDIVSNEVANAKGTASTLKERLDALVGAALDAREGEIVEARNAAGQTTHTTLGGRIDTLDTAVTSLKASVDTLDAEIDAAANATTDGTHSGVAERVRDLERLLVGDTHEDTAGVGGFDVGANSGVLNGAAQPWVRGTPNANVPSKTNKIQGDYDAVSASTYDPGAPGDDGVSAEFPNHAIFDATPPGEMAVVNPKYKLYAAANLADEIAKARYGKKVNADGDAKEYGTIQEAILSFAKPNSITQVTAGVNLSGADKTLSNTNLTLSAGATLTSPVLMPGTYALRLTSDPMNALDVADSMKLANVKYVNDKRLGGGTSGDMTLAGGAEADVRISGGAGSDINNTGGNTTTKNVVVAAAATLPSLTVSGTASSTSLAGGLTHAVGRTLTARHVVVDTALTLTGSAAATFDVAPIVTSPDAAGTLAADELAHKGYFDAAFLSKGGSTSLSNVNLTATGALVVGGGWNSGAANLASALTASAGVAVTGAYSTSGNATVTGNYVNTTSGTLAVTGALSLTGTGTVLSTSGAGSLGGAVTAAGLSATGTTTLTGHATHAGSQTLTGRTLEVDTALSLSGASTATFAAAPVVTTPDAAGVLGATELAHKGYFDDSFLLKSAANSVSNVNMTVTGGVSVGGTLSAGAANLAAALTANGGVAVAAGNWTTSTNGSITGDLVASGVASTLATTGVVTLTGTTGTVLTSTGAASVAGVLTVAQNLASTGALSLSGLLTAGAAASVTGALSTTTTLGSTGALSVTGTSTFTGDAMLSSTSPAVFSATPGAYSNATQLTSKGYVDAQVLAGGAFTGNMTLDGRTLNIGTGALQVTNAATPLLTSSLTGSTNLTVGGTAAIHTLVVSNGGVSLSAGSLTLGAGAISLSGSVQAAALTVTGTTTLSNDVSFATGKSIVLQGTGTIVSASAITIGTPTTAGHASTKAYIDAEASWTQNSDFVVDVLAIDVFS